MKLKDENLDGPGGVGGTDLLYFSEESIGTLDLPLTQLSKGHLLKVNLKTGTDR